METGNEERVDLVCHSKVQEKLICQLDGESWAEEITRGPF